MADSDPLPARVHEHVAADSNHDATPERSRQRACRQVYRAAEALEELLKGRIEFVHHNRHGKMLIESAAARAATVSRRQRLRGEPRWRTACQTIARKQEQSFRT